jgi:hypothetical protein
VVRSETGRLEKDSVRHGRTKHEIGADETCNSGWTKPVVLKRKGVFCHMPVISMLATIEV